MDQTTALIVFVKYPSPGRVKTRLAKEIGEDAAAQCYRLMAQECIERYRSIPATHCMIYYDPVEEEGRYRQWLGSGLDYIPQGPGNLGDRLAHGFVAALERFPQAIALGTDSPTLPPQNIESAARALASRDVVIGPTEDGGYYLIGLKSFDPRLFQEIAWSTDQVFAQTQQRCQQAKLTTLALPPWFDVDTQADLQRLYHQTGATLSGPLQGWLDSFFASKSTG